MRLYAGSSSQFQRDTIQNQIAEKLSRSFFDYYRYRAPQGEVMSWRNSLRAMANVLQYAELHDHGIILEYQLPQTSKRLDCLVCGKDDGNRGQAIIVELKQWEQCEASDGDNEVHTWVGGGKRDVLHPSVQVDRYREYLEDTHTAFNDDPERITLSSCVYLHNYVFQQDDVLLSNKFGRVLSSSPLFSGDDVPDLAQFLHSRMERGDGLEVLGKIEQSRFRPSKKLMDYIGHAIKGEPAYILLDEQLVAYDRIFAAARGGFHDKRKSVLIVRGGPGTGKSVIALNVMADLLMNGYNAHYATGSRAFTESLRKILGTRSAAQIKYFNSYTEASDNDIDVLLCDESHRIRETSSGRFTPKSKRSNISQVEELMRSSKVSVFFIDDRQVVRPNEVGSSDSIREVAVRLGARVEELELEAQFRCNGSAEYVNWLNNTLGIERNVNVMWNMGEQDFDFRIMESPEEVEQAILKRVQEGYSGRMMAGFCWPWSDPAADGTLVNDVVIGEYKRPWNANPEAKRLARGIPKAVNWARDPNGIHQIGCVYTAQGFEFDYVGVIIGLDMVYDFDAQSFKGRPGFSHDSVVKKAKDQFLEMVKNTYRVLLTRGLKGCYVYLMDKDTERFIKSRIEWASVRYPEVQEAGVNYVAEKPQDHNAGTEY